MIKHLDQDEENEYEFYKEESLVDDNDDGYELKIVEDKVVDGIGELMKEWILDSMILILMKNLMMKKVMTSQLIS